MTLFRQLMITIVMLFTMMLVVVMLINFNTTKEYLVNQLASTTQDSATSLSMSVSDFMGEQDYASVESSINAVYDSGYFSQVKIHVYETEQDLTRAGATVIAGVPSWFVELIDFNVPTATAIISNGWNELGLVSITGSAGYGYYQLWLASRDLLLSFLIIGTLSVIIGGLALRQLFKPLAEVEAQAEAIQQRRFVKMQNLPKTRELKSVVLSMNRMAEKLEKEFAAEAETAQWLQAKAFKDPVSGLGNRNFYESQVNTHFSDPDRTIDGLILISLADLAKLNNERGYEAADTFIRSAADIVQKSIRWRAGAAIVARLSGADFVVLMTNIDFESLQKTVNTMRDQLLELATLRMAYADSVANIGAVMIDATVSKSTAMAQADAALRAAKTSGINQTQIFDIETGQNMAIGRLAWKEMLEHAIQHNAFRLRKQSVAELADLSNVVQQEVFASLEYDDKLYHAGYFIGLAEQFDLGVQVDQVIVGLTIEHIKQRTPSVPLTINLSTSAYIKPSFILWLDKTLSALTPVIKQQLAFEISEQSVLSTEDHASMLANVLSRHNVIFGIDNVGKHFSAFQYLQTLMPNYVKVDPSYTRMAVGKESESFFMHTLCKMFNSLNIQVIATGVESREQLDILKRFDIYAAQGYVLGKTIELS